MIGEIKCFIEPAPSALELFCEGESISKSCGDTFWASVNRLQYATNLFWCAPQLSKVEKVLTEALEFFDKRDPSKVGFILVIQQSLNKLLGCSNDIRNDQSIFIGHSAMKNVRIGMSM
jgi:hypothetical protein